MPNNLVKPVISATAAGLGAAIGGPLGGALGVWLGSAMGHTAGALIGNYTEEFGKDAGKKLIESGGDSLIEKLKKNSPDLEQAFRETLRLSLAAVNARSGIGYEDWFAHWERALVTPGSLNLQPILAGDLEPGHTDRFIHRVLEDLDAQGEQLARKSTSFHQKRRPLPEPLFSILEQQLPEYLQQYFSVLINSSEYESAWREAQLNFSRFARASLQRIEDALETIDAIDRKTDVLPQVAHDVHETHQTVLELRRLLENSERQRALEKDKAAPPPPSTGWDEFFETALSQGAVIYEDPWESWKTEAERDFKHLLHGRGEKQIELWNGDRWHEIIDLWKPLQSSEYFDVTHPDWQDRPFFRCLIHQANCGLFAAHGHLAIAAEDMIENYRKTMKFLLEVLKEHPYSMLGAADDRLSTGDARTQNENFVTTLLMARDFLKGWGGPSTLRLIGMDQSQGQAIEKQVNTRLNELRWVLEKHPEKPSIS